LQLQSGSLINFDSELVAFIDENRRYDGEESKNGEELQDIEVVMTARGIVEGFDFADEGCIILFVLLIRILDFG
jgi:hypothetical protein